MLTPKQKDLLMFIHQRVTETGVPPSFDEMKLALDLKSKSGIHRLITALEERGFIRRLPHRARALEIVKMPEFAMQPRLGDRTADRHGSLSPSGRDGQGRPRSQLEASIEPAFLGSGATTVPMMGRIAAGVPIAAIQSHTQDVGVPPDLLRGKGEHFVLEVKGDSMIEAGIMEGDTVIIERCSTAGNGEIVVALVDQEEATLKRLRKRGASVALEAANPAYETRIFGPDRVEIQGRLVGLIRRY